MNILRPAAAGLLAAVLPAQEPAVDSTGTGWELVRLDLDVRVEPAPGAMTATGKAQLRLKLSRSAGPTLAVRYFDFTSVAAGDAKIDTTSRHPRLNEVRLAEIRLPEPAVRGALVDVDFAIAMRESASQLYVDGDIALASWVMAWYPFPLPPDSEGYNAGHSRAPGMMSFHLPKGWRAISEGRRTEARETEEGTFETWHVREPVARSFAAGPYRVGAHVVGEREFAVYVLDQDVAAAGEQAESLGAAIAAMEKGFGPFPFESYAIAEIPTGKVGFYGASQQGFLMADSTAFRYGSNLPLFAHEAAHAWWGNAVGTRGQGSIVCSESLAQYGVVVAIEALEGRDAATEFLRFSRRGYNPLQCARGYFQMAWRDQDKPLSQLESGGWQHDLSDAKGHWVFHMLRRRVGDQLFFGTLRGLLDEHRGDSMSLDDLRAAFIRAAPKERELETFFAQWMDRAGAPELDSDWEPNDGGGVDVTIAQLQAGEPFDLRLELALHFDDGSVARHEVHLTDAKQVFELAAERPVDHVALDPDHRLLIWTPDYGPAPHTLLTDDGVVDAAARIKYVGTYRIDENRVLQIVERGERIGGQMGQWPLRLKYLGGHRFRSERGVLEFVFEQGEVVGIDFIGDDGQRERAERIAGSTRG